MALSKLINEVHGPLKLFNQKAQKLRNLSFVKQYKTSKNSVRIKATKHPEYGAWNIEVDSKRASDESIEAVSLTLRFFIQDNEQCSFRNLSKLYEQIDPIVGLKSQYELYRIQLNTLLSNESQPQPKENEYKRPLLFRDILEIFMYGGLSHANEEKKKVYDRWMSEEVSCAVFTHLFHRIVHEMIIIIGRVAELNNIALMRLNNVKER